MKLIIIPIIFLKQMRRINMEIDNANSFIEDVMYDDNFAEKFGIKIRRDNKC